MAHQLHYTKIEQEDINVARMKGELFIERGKIRLGIQNEQILSRRLGHCYGLGSENLQILLTSLQKLGMSTRVEEVTSTDMVKKRLLCMLWSLRTP